MINIMYCGNDKMFDGVLISTLSIAHHTSEALNVYLLTMDQTKQKPEYKPITENQAQIVEEAIQKYNKDSKVNLIDCTAMFDEEMAKSKNLKTHYTPYIFLRLMVDIIPDMPEKILYLDTDVVAYQDISELWQIDLKDYELTASLDYIGRNAISQDYINSGVLLMNIPEIRKNKSFEKCREICKTKKMVLPDQTAIYKTCKIKRIDDKYNEQKRRHEDTILRHFSMQLNPYPMNIKPWHIDKLHEVYKIFDLDDILKEYQDIKAKSEKI